MGEPRKPQETAVDFLNGGRWFEYVHARPDARLRLFCIPFLGADASIFRSWHEALPNYVEVLPIQLPGRGKRFNEPPITRSAVLVGSLTKAIGLLLDRPFALYGHSLGALVAFELAKSLRAVSGVAPVSLFVSGCVAPQHMHPADSLATLPEREFIEELRKLNGTPRELLNDPSLLKIFLPTLRADFSLLASFANPSVERLSFPIVAFCGMEDEQASPESMLRWKDVTTERFDFNLLPGDHFFIVKWRSAFLEMFTSCIETLDL